jgi:hypothetical protein
LVLLARRPVALIVLSIRRSSDISFRTGCVKALPATMRATRLGAKNIFD